MRKFIIISDSCCDLNKLTREKYNIEYIPMSVSYNGKVATASLDWDKDSTKEYYDLIRKGTRVLTSQVTKDAYIKAFEYFVQKGYDILSISCSSALSASVNASYLAKEEIISKHPEAKIICIDSLISSFGLGLLCIIASKLRAENKTIEETAEFIEQIKLNLNQFGTVADLKYLKLAGRITTSTALLGTLFNIKPIIISDTKGQNVSIEKIKGRKKVIERIAELTKQNYTGFCLPDIYIGHADCEEEANALKDLIVNSFPNKDLAVHICCIGPILGASCGPGMLAVYFIGNKKLY